MDGPALAGPVASGSHMADKMAATRAACCDLSWSQETLRASGSLAVHPCAAAAKTSGYTRGQPPREPQ